VSKTYCLALKILGAAKRNGGNESANETDDVGDGTAERQKINRIFQQ
jgi:hypothetical protein